MTDLELKKIFADNLNYYLQRSNKSQKEIADAIDVLPQTFNTWTQGIAIPRMGKVQLLADYFHIRKSDLIEARANHADAKGAGIADKCSEIQTIMKLEDSPLPFAGCAGSAGSVTDIADLVMKVSDDSMKDDAILSGDLILLHEQTDAENGQIVAVSVGEQILLRRFYFFADKNSIALRPANPEFEELVFSGDQMSDVRILGTMTGLYRSM